MRAYTSVYRANHCPSASADPRVSRALETFSTGEEGSLREFPPRRGVPPGGKNPFFFFFFLPRANWPTSGDKVGRKTVSVDIEPRRHRRPVRSSHRARRVHLDERPRTNVPRISSAAVSKPFLKDVERIRRRRWRGGGVNGRMA